MTSVAPMTQRNQVLFRIIAQSAPRSEVVNLEILQRPAPLATPAVPPQHPLAECCVQFRIQAHPRSLLSKKTLLVGLRPRSLRMLERAAQFPNLTH